MKSKTHAGIFIRAEDEFFFARHFRLGCYASETAWYITTTSYTAPRSIRVPDEATGRRVLDLIQDHIAAGETVFDARRALAQIAREDESSVVEEI